MAATSLDELIAAATRSDGGLTPSERKVATFLETHPTALAFDTVATVAQRVGVSGPTVIRFATKLGFEGYASLQHHAQRLITNQLRRPTDRHRQSGDVDDSTWDAQHSAAVASVARVFTSTTSADIESLSSLIASTRGRVWITASGTASAAAYVLANGLTLLRPNVHHLAGSAADISAALIDASADDVAIALDTPRYEHRVVETATWLADHGATVVAITDGPLSPLVALADSWVSVDVHAVGPFDSALPTVTVAELVVASVARQLGTAATERLDRAEAMWALHKVFVDD